MELRTTLNIYFDFYGQLLTDKQQQIFKLYYQDDLSLSEIAEEMQVTRQAVHDILQRSDKQLQYYENKLLLVEKFLQQKDKLTIAYKLLEKENHSNGIEKAFGILKSIILDEQIEIKNLEE